MFQLFLVPMGICPHTLCMQKPLTSPSLYHFTVITLAPFQAQAVLFISVWNSFWAYFPFSYMPQTSSGPLKLPWTLMRNAPESHLPAPFGQRCGAQKHSLHCFFPLINDSCNPMSPLLSHCSKLAATGSRSHIAFDSNLLFVHLCSKGQAILVSYVDPALLNPFILLSYTCYVTLL